MDTDANKLFDTLITLAEGIDYDALSSDDLTDLAEILSQMTKNAKAALKRKG